MYTLSTYQKVKKFNNWTLLNRPQQMIENLNDEQNEVVKEIGFGGFLHL